MTQLNTTSLIPALLADLVQIATSAQTGLDLDRYQPVKVQHQSYSFDTPTAVTHFIAQQGIISGWIQETSHIQHLHAEKYQSRSFPLNAEWHDGQYGSYVLDYAGRNRWTIQHYTLKTNSSEPTHLAEKMLHCEVDHDQQLVYQRLWHLDQGVPVADIAIFTGFENA